METTLTTECIEDYLRWLLDPQYSNSAHTIKAYSSDIRMFFREWRVESFQAQELNSLAAAWLKWSRETRKLSASTIVRRKAALRSFSRFIQMDGAFLPHFQAPSIPQRNPHPLPGLEDDLEALINVASSDEARALVACLGYQGMRMHEALSQPLSKINFVEGAIEIIGKGDKERRVPITRNGVKYIMPMYVRAMCAGVSNLIGLQDRTARNLITNMGERAGLSRAISSHDLRATFATVVYRDTKDIRLVQVLLGHADINTTQIYIGLTFDQMREAIG